MRLSALILLLVTYCLATPIPAAAQDIETINGKIESWKPGKEIVIIRDLSGSEYKLSLNENTDFTVDGKPADTSSILYGMRAKVKVARSKKVLSVEVMSKEYLAKAKSMEEAQKTKQLEETKADLQRWLQRGEIVVISLVNTRMVSCEVIAMTHSWIKVTDGRLTAVIKGKDISRIHSQNQSFSWNESKQSFELFVEPVREVRPLSREARESRVLEKMILAALAHWAKKSVEENGTGNDVLDVGIYLFSSYGRDRWIEESIRLIFPEFSKQEVSIVKSIVVRYLDKTLTPEGVTKDVMKDWFVEELKKGSSDETKNLITFTNEVAELLAKMHEGAQKRRK